MSVLLFVLPLCLNFLHVPHDSVHGVATAHLPGGAVETIIATHRESKVLRTRDDGLSWQPVFGAGLELARPDVVLWDSYSADPKFFIGTEIGIWTYDPVTNDVQPFNNGLPNEVDNMWACQMSVPKAGADGPVFMANKAGEVWRLDRSANSWELVLDSGYTDERAQVAVVPNFDNSAGVGVDRVVLAAFAGVLFYSRNGGDHWTKHSQFSIPATTLDDPLITALAFAEDFEVSGDLVLATSKRNFANHTGDEGTIWRSSDFGNTFQIGTQLTSSIRSLASTPLGPDGERWFLASLLEHPVFQYLNLSTGVLRSSDGGATWSDFGSAQDFIQEIDASGSVPANRSLIQQFGVSPDYANDGRILFVRSEGLYYSNNGGLQWIRRSFRPPNQIRGLDSVITPAGELVAFSGGYGAGTMVHNLATGDVTLLHTGPNSYVDEVLLSPKFNEDGMMIVGGSRGPSLWYDPILGASNPHQTLGWMAVDTDLRLGYTRALAFSPHYDARGLPGSDQVFFFGTSNAQTTTFTSKDGGLTVEAISQMIDGTDAPNMRYLAVAPTFDSQVTTGPIDVYGANGRFLYRLRGGRWEEIFEFPAMVKSMDLAPDFDRDPLTPGLPRLFMALRTAPFFVEFIDEIDNPIMNGFGDGLNGGDPVSVKCPSNFGDTQSVYLATFASGVKRLDLSQPSPEWVSVGLNFPNLWATSMTLSPDFASNPTIMVGSQAGLVVGQDPPVGEWQYRRPSVLMDDEAPSFRLFQPAQPGNPDPMRTMRWESMPIYNYRDTNLSFIDSSVSFTSNDGSYIECAEYAGGIILHSFRGLDCGKVTITVENFWTGQPVASLTKDLAAPSWHNEAIVLDFTYQPVNIRIEADLAPSQIFYFDGVTLLPH